MRKVTIYKIVVFTTLLLLGFISKAQYIEVKDPVFANFLCESYPHLVSADCLSLDTVQAKLETGTLDCDSLDIYEIPELRYFEQIKRVKLNEAHLSEFPDFSYLPNILQISLNGNNISGTIDVSEYTTLETLILNRNTYLSEIIGLEKLTNLRMVQFTSCSFRTVEDLSNLPALTSVDIRYNELTFTDILPQTNHPNYETVFSVLPQHPVNDSDSMIVKIAGNAFDLSYDYDADIDGLTYSWYFNDTIIKQGSDTYLSIPSVSETNSGEYRASVKSDNPLLKGDSITSRYFILEVLPDPCSLELGAEIEFTPYCDSIGVQIAVLQDEFEYSYYIENTFNKKKTVFENDIPFSVTEGTYTIYATTGNCDILIEKDQDFTYKDYCKKYFTPNGDGDGDTYIIDYKGTFRIVNTQGEVIKELVCPAEWDGTTDANSLAPDGEYMITDFESIHIQISLLR